ncbi:MAG: T9SS type A sorting domain-containing protein [candidate division Zixibacteria bacterium]|nr:T9SS type A sorting domain-containing protein [candidate division Zixibacteria bacterium]
MKLLKLLLMICGAFLLTAVSFAGVNNYTHTEVNQQFGVSSSSIQTLIIHEGVSRNLSTTVEIDGEELILDLYPHSIRSDRFEVLVQYDSQGGLVPVKLPQSKTYRGVIRGENGTLVSGSYKEGSLSAAVFMDGREYTIQPLAEGGFENSEGEYIVYSAEDVIITGEYTCGTTEDMRVTHTPDEPVIMDTGRKIAEVACDADYNFYQLNGYSVENTVDDIENVMNNVEAKYEVSGIMITFEITTIVVRTSTVYTSTDPNNLLCQFRDRWNSAPESYIQRDHAHLFTGKNINGGVIGIAWLGVVCNRNGNDCGSYGNLAYGLSQSRFSGNLAYRVALSAHEMGHNWDATHCDGDTDCGIMCSVIGGCSGPVTAFGSQARGEIYGYRNSASCLVNEPDPLSYPLLEEFPTSNLNTDIWVYNDGGMISTYASNEPSPPYSLNLDSQGSQDYRDNEVRTGFIDLYGLANIELRYFTQHTGVESGKELIVEFWGNDEMWHEINTIVSDGNDQTEFEEWIHVLPSSAYHNEFRVRFATDGTSSDDDWYIDNVFVTQGEPVVVEVTMIPHNPPIQVVQGGYFTFTGILENQTDESQVTDLWVMVGLPGGNEYGPIVNYWNINLAPNQQISVWNVRQDIPSYAPLGDYDYNAYTGDYPDVVDDTASFPFSVISGIAGSSGQWSLSGWFDDKAGEIPTSYRLLDNYPNPFNARTSITFEIPRTEYVSLDVYNIFGQRVETLLAGNVNAGTHTVNWDAAAYASGVYFYRLEAGDVVRTKKMNLLK